MTGRSRGLWRNTVLNLAKRQVESIFTYNSNRAEADKGAALVAEAGRPAVDLQLDTNEFAGFGDFLNEVQQALSSLEIERFDYLYHASSETTEAALDALYKVYVKGVFFLTQKLPPLINDRGRVVNLASRHPHHHSRQRRSMRWGSCALGRDLLRQASH